MRNNLIKKVFFTDCSWTAPAGVKSVRISALKHAAIRKFAATQLSGYVIDANDDMYAWGSNLCGQLGIGSITAQCLPTLVCCGLKWASLAMNSHSSSQVMGGITTTGEAYTWGEGFCGDLGNGTITNACLPTPVSCGFRWKSLNMANGLAIGIRDNGDAYAWGNNHCSAFGNGTILDVQCLPTPQLCCGLKWRSIGVGDEFGAGISVDCLGYSWGTNCGGKLGRGDTGPHSQPNLICCGLKWKQLSVGSHHMVGLTVDNLVYAWGCNSCGKLGIGSLTAKCQPVPVCLAGVQMRAVQVAAGDGYTMAITPEGDAYAWGSNLCGQLGNGSITAACVPTLVCCGIKWHWLSAGNNHSLGMSINGELFTMGSGGCGRLGVGSITPNCLPMLVCCPKTNVPNITNEKVSSHVVVPGQVYCISVLANFSSFNFDPIANFAEAIVLEYYHAISP